MVTAYSRSTLAKVEALLADGATTESAAASLQAAYPHLEAAVIRRYVETAQASAKEERAGRHHAMASKPTRWFQKFLAR